MRRLASTSPVWVSSALKFLPPLHALALLLFLPASAFAQALRYAIEQKVDVISISMGGAPSRAWNEAVNDAYEAGICICAAAGRCPFSSRSASSASRR